MEFQNDLAAYKGHHRPQGGSYLNLDGIELFLIQS